MEKTTIDTERLLEHRDFLLRLARSLSRDESTAEDLVQETWLAALRRPPRHDGGLRAWLGLIARRLASNRSRDGWSREGRERRSARPEVLDPDRDLDGTLELQRDIVDALRELREPYRRTLYLRFYRDLAPREIASREGLPLPTVKSRLQRGLAELRESLDRERGGQRALWAAPLAGFLETGTETAAVAAAGAGWMGGMIALQKLVVAAVVVALAGGAWFVANRDSGEAEPAEGGAPPAVGTGVIPPAVEVAVTTPEVETGPGRSAVELARAGDSAPAANPAVVTGSLVFESGAPAPGIEVTMRRWLQRYPEGPDRSRRLDPPAPVRTDPAGEFEFRMALAEPIHLHLEARLPGHVSVVWTDRELEPAGRLSLEEKMLAPAGSLFVKVRGPDGELVAGTWEFDAEALDHEDPDWKRRSVRVEPDRTEDSARFEGLPAGRLRVRAYSALVGGGGLSRVVEIRPGEELPLIFTYDGPDPGRRIVVRTEVRPSIIDEGMPPGAWRLEREGEAPRTPENTHSTELVFDDLATGPYTLTCLDPRYEPWKQDGLEPGTMVRARLRGRSAIQLEVLGADGGVLHDYALSIIATREGGIHEKSLRNRGREEPEGGIYRGLYPTELDVTVPETVLSRRARETRWAIEVEAVGYSPKVVELDCLLPNEVTPVTVLLDRGATIVGRVRSADGGVPADEVQILLTRGPLPAARGLGINGSSWWQGQQVPDPEAATTADEDGRFCFESVGEGEWTLRAVQGPWLIVDETIRMAPGESAEVELAMPPTGSLVVRFDVPEQADLTQHRLGLSAAASTTRVGWRGDWRRQHVAMVRGEACTFEPLPAGEYILSLIVSYKSSRGELHIGGCGALETVRLVSGERRELNWDLRARFPARLGLRATVDGRPCHDVRTAPHPLADSGLPGATGDGNFMPLTNDTGVDCPLPVTPGPYGIDVYSGDGHWGYTLPDPIHLRPAETRIVELELSLLTGIVRLVDNQTGAPLIDCSVEWFLGKRDPFLSTRTHRFLTNAEGCLELRFPETELGLVVEGYEPIRLRWPSDPERELRLRATE